MYLLSLLKTAMQLFYFFGNLEFFRIFLLIESSEEQHLFEIAIFCNINIFTVTFNQLNASLLNKTIDFLLDYFLK